MISSAAGQGKSGLFFLFPVPNHRYTGHLLWTELGDAGWIGIFSDHSSFVFVPYGSYNCTSLPTCVTLLSLHSLQEGGSSGVTVGIVHSLLGHQQRNPCEIQTAAVVWIYSPKQRTQMLLFFLQATAAWDRTSAPNHKPFSLIINRFQNQNQFLFSSSVLLFRGLTVLLCFWHFFSFNFIPSTLKSFPFSYTYSMQCPPLPDLNFWSYRLNLGSLVHGTLYRFSPHSHLDWHLNCNIYRQTLYTHRQNKPDSVLWLNTLVRKDHLGSSFTVLTIQIWEINSLIQDWLRSWSPCCREENGWEPQRTLTLEKRKHLCLMRPITKQVGGGGESKLLPSPVWQLEFHSKD